MDLVHLAWTEVLVLYGKETSSKQLLAPSVQKFVGSMIFLYKQTIISFTSFFVVFLWAFLYG